MRFPLHLGTYEKPPPPDDGFSTFLLWRGSGLPELLSGSLGEPEFSTKAILAGAGIGR